uniref:Uncharacterized protein n=1 Tax=Parascaris equorum TaxID=6256 RepID=A0A914RXD1_PAREQ
MQRKEETDALDIHFRVVLINGSLKTIFLYDREGERSLATFEESTIF